MSGLSVDRAITAPAERVWAQVTDLGSAERTLSAVDHVSHVAGPFPRIGVGTVWEETRTMMGRSETQQMRCTAVDETAMRYTVEADAHGAHYETVIAVVPEGSDACRVSMSFDAEPQTAAARVLGMTIGRLFAGATRKALAEDLDDIARAAMA